MAAVHPAGVPAAVFGELLPQPGAESVATRQLHDWLGADGTGLPRLCSRDGAWRLSPEVRVDWQVFQGLAGAGSPDPEEERRRLAAALGLIRGELLSGIRFGPLARQALKDDTARIQALVVHAVHRDTELSRAAGDLARTEWAIRQGLVLLPRSQDLWRMLLQFQAEHQPEAVGPTVERMKAVLAGAKLDPETRKLVSRLGKATARRSRR
jgi:hypothetical protein